MNDLLEAQTAEIKESNDPGIVAFLM